MKRSPTRSEAGDEMTDLPETIDSHLRGVRAGSVRIPERIDALLGRIRQHDPRIGAFLHVMDAEARSAAEQLQSRVERGEWPGPLTGVPIAVKDNICVQGHPTTAASRILTGFTPLYTATAVERLRQAGAIVIGKTNLDEFAMGSSNEHSAVHAVHNPHDLGRVPGGSSGGSAAAIAAGMALGALGSDTGGSVRQPAAFCGLVALKPQYGAVSRYGLIAFGSSLDQIAPMARTARDCARIENVIAGPDPHDATSLPERRPIDLDGLEAGIEGLRIGVPAGWVAKGLDAEVAALFESAGERFRARGARVLSVDLFDPEWGIAAYYILATAEASSNLARYDGVRYGYRAAGARDLASLYERTRGAGFGAEVKRRILLGTFVLSAGYYDAYYRRAMQVRAMIRTACEAVFARVDALLVPASPTPAFRLGEKLEDPLAMYLSDVFTVVPNLTGFPAVAFPVGRTAGGLPVGAQLFGPAESEARLLQLAHQATGGEALPLAAL